MKHFKNISVNNTGKYNIPGINSIKEWLNKAITSEGFSPGNISYTLVSDEELRKLNNQVLNHNYYTDIITFDISDEEKSVEADIYISFDRVKENAKAFHVKQMEELGRVMLHGLLHLMGYDDHTEKDIEEMRKKENLYLRKLKLKP